MKLLVAPESIKAFVLMSSVLCMVMGIRKCEEGMLRTVPMHPVTVVGSASAGLLVALIKNPGRRSAVAATPRMLATGLGALSTGPSSLPLSVLVPCL